MKAFKKDIFQKLSIVTMALSLVSLTSVAAEGDRVSGGGLGRMSLMRSEMKSAIETVRGNFLCGNGEMEIQVRSPQLALGIAELSKSGLPVECTFEKDKEAGPN